MSELYYTIKVGDVESLSIQVGTLNKTTGEPAAGWVPGIAPKGVLSIPNYSKIWAKQEKKNGKLTGEITPLPWGADGGMVVELRYIQSCRSIDKQYQDELKIKPSEEEDSEIELDYGLNEFDEKVYPMKCLMLKLHGFNGSNTSRNPQGKVVFTTYEPEKQMNIQASFIQLRQQGENMVVDARYKPKKLRALASLFEMDVKQLDEILFNQLLEYTQKPDVFWNVINLNKKKFEVTLKKSRDLGIIDLSLPNIVQLVKNEAKDYLINSEYKIEGDTDKEKIEFMLGNMIEPEIFDGLNRLYNELQQYETAELQ